MDVTVSGVEIWPGGELRLQYRALRCRSDEQRIPGQHALAIVRLRRRPALQPRGYVRTFDRDSPALDIDVDDVSILKRCQRSAGGCLGRHVPDHEPSRRAREATVSHHRDRLAQPFAHDGRGDLEHLAHSGSAARAFVPDHDRVARLDLAAGHRREGVLLTVENASWTPMRGRRVLRDLDHRALGRKRAAEDDEPAFAPQRLRKWRHDLLPARLADRLALLAECPTRDGERITVDKAAFDQSFRQHADAAGAMQLDRGEAAARLEVAQQRSPAADAIDVVDV